MTPIPRYAISRQSVSTYQALEGQWMQASEVLPVLDAQTEALKLAYRKHHLNDDTIGWDELSDALATALGDTLGPAGFEAWLKTLSWR